MLSVFHLKVTRVFAHSKRVLCSSKMPSSEGGTPEVEPVVGMGLCMTLRPRSWVGETGEEWFEGIKSSSGGEGRSKKTA